MMIQKNNAICWALLLSLCLGGCMMPLKPVSNEGSNAKSGEEVGKSVDNVWGELGDYLEYYESFGILDGKKADEEMMRQLEAIEGGSLKARLFLALARMNPATEIYNPTAARKGLAALLEEDVVSQTDVQRFIVILLDVIASQKSFEIMAAQKNNELVVAANKIKSLAQDVHKYKKEAEILAAQIEELKDIEKLIIKRQNTKPLK